MKNRSKPFFLFQVRIKTTNTEHARARLEDADLAYESSQLSKAQILQQSAMAMIAQASRIQQNVLTLFQ